MKVDDALRVLGSTTTACSTTQKTTIPPTRTTRMIPTMTTTRATDRAPVTPCEFDGRLADMAFKVRFTEKQEKPDDYETDDVYDFLEGGVLSIAFTNDAKWTQYYAPGSWVQVSADQNHRPGQTGGEPGVFPEAVFPA
jgi:hypothetical protein